MINHIATTWSEGGNGWWRVLRLHQVIGYVRATMPEALNAVEHLHDHEGMLSVYWNSLPGKGWTAAFEAAWELIDGGPVDHRRV